MALSRLFLLMCILSLSINSCGVFNSSEKGKHLFILSGQSNMVLLDPNQSFIPPLEKEFGTKNIIVVKDAKGAQPISRWYKKAAHNQAELIIGDLYDRLFKKVTDSVQNQKLQSVTFIWMQGERDARLANADVYESYLVGLYQQLSEDLKRDDINFVIGRLNDFDMNNSTWPHWTKIRDIQVKVAESNPRFDWVNTDNFNTGVGLNGKQLTDNIHMSKEGYHQLGRAFAQKASTLINLKN